MSGEGEAGGGALLLRLLRVSPREVPKVLRLALLAGLSSAGLAIGLTVSSTLFLVHRGAGELPILYLAMPLLMAVYTPISSFLLGRLGIDRLYRWILLLLVAGGVGLAFLLPSKLGVSEPLPWAFYVASLYTGLWVIALYTQFWSFAGDYFDIRDAKRLFPLLTGGMALGSIAGGAAVATLSSFGLVGELYLLWSVLAALSLLPLKRIVKEWRKLETGEDEEEMPFGRQLRELGGHFRRERYVVVLTAMLFLVMLLSSLCNFEYMAIFSMDRAEEDLATLLGGLYSAVNVFNLVMNLFVFNRLVALVGVPRAAMVMPLAYLVVFGTLAVQPGFAGALLGFFAFEGLLWSIDFNNQNFLFNALPAGAQKEIRMVLEGLTEPIATAVVGGSLLLVRGGAGETTLEDLAVFAQYGVIGALLALVLAQLLRVDYLRAMVVNLKRHWLDFSRPEAEVVGSLDDAEIARLAERGTLDDPETTRLALDLLWLNDRARAVDLTLDLVTRAGREQSGELAPVVGKIFVEGGGELVGRVLEVLEPKLDRLSPAILEELGRNRLLQPQRVDEIAARFTDDPAWREPAAVGLLNSWRPEANRLGLGIVSGMLESDPEERRRAIRVLGRTGRELYAYYVVADLEADAPELRHEALEALEGLVTPRSGRLIPQLLTLLARDREPEQRRRVLDILDRIRDPDCIVRLLALAGSFAPSELRRCERIVLGMGLKAVPKVVRVLRDPGLPFKARSIAARALGKIAFAQLEALSDRVIDRQLQHAEDAVLRGSLLDRRPSLTPGLRVLRRLYRDVPRASLDFILEILSIGGRLPDYELLATSLRSKNPKLRGDAIETLEQGLDRGLFARLLPLVEGVSAAGGAPEEEDEADGEAVERIVVSALESDLPLELTAGLQSARELDTPPLARALRERLERPMGEMSRRLIEEALVGEEANTVEKLDLLAAAGFFDPFELAALVPLANAARVTGPADGEVYAAGDAADRFYLVLGGRVRLGAGDGSALGPGEVFGEESLFGQRVRPAGATGEGLELLELPVEALLGAAASDPVVALRLLEKQYVAAGGRQEAA